MGVDSEKGRGDQKGRGQGQEALSRESGALRDAWGSPLGVEQERRQEKAAGEGDKAEDTGVGLGDALMPCCGSGGLRLPSRNPDHAACQPSRWRLFLSLPRFPRSSKGFPEVIRTLDSPVQPYLSISQMGEQDTTWLTYLSKIRV